MRIKRHEIRPIVEGCETRTLLSAGALPAMPAAVARASAMQVVQLHGTMQGQYVQNTVIADVGSVFGLNGSGRLNGFEKANLAGSLHSVGFIANGHAQGTLVLTGRRGTITLILVGAEAQNGPAGLPRNFTFAITAGTGRFRHVGDHGSATLSLQSGGPSSGTNAFVIHGTFKLTLKSYPEPAV
jgi:hypothetical protein